MKRIFFVMAALFVVMEIVSIYVSQNTSEEKQVLRNETNSTGPAVSKSSSTGVAVKSIDEEEKTFSEESEEVAYPRVTIEEKADRIERTIHMGVRQYAWDPKELRVKEGELVRLIIHNADVMHGIAIPGLDVNMDIPPEGAIIEFVARKKGTEEFFCAVYCGEGHMGMRGKIIIE